VQDASSGLSVSGTGPNHPLYQEVNAEISHINRFECRLRISHLEGDHILSYGGYILSLWLSGTFS